MKLLSQYRSSLLAALLVLAPCMSAAHAQSVQVNVPFAFDCGGLHYSPGTYMLHQQRDNLMQIQGASMSGIAMVQVTPNNPGQPKARNGAAVFNVYGKQYFLRKIVIQGDTSYIDFGSTKSEKQLRKQLQVADNDINPGTVELALMDSPR